MMLPGLPRPKFRKRRFQMIADTLLYAHINAEDSDAALNWYRGFKQAILSLEHQPNRCPVTPESVKFRNLLYGNKPHIYRAIYRVIEKQKQVEVMHIRHGARRRFKRADVA